MIIKKGAMFGLDARIALAIFGALSVIAGASLYSAIQESKVVSMHTDMMEIGKAWESYLLDTGTDLPKIGTGNTWVENSRQTAKLVTDSTTGWQGPYLQYKIGTVGAGTANKYLLYKDAGVDNGTYNGIYIDSARDNTWGGTNYWADADVGKCNNTDPCYVWVRLIGFTANQPYFAQIDELVDGSDGADAGNFRYRVKDSQYHVFIKYTPYKQLS
jgi:Tfp pilus assembly protein PilE